MFIIQTDAALHTTAATQMILSCGASASNIFWLVGAATTLGAPTTFVGTIIGSAAVTVGAVRTIYAHALSVTAALNRVRRAKPIRTIRTFPAVNGRGRLLARAYCPTVFLS